MEAFSSHDALADTTCGGTLPNLENVPTFNIERMKSSSSRSAEGQSPQRMQLWNAMIHPLRKMRFTGVIWYQGEANAGNPSSYACRFPAMITDWRNKLDLPDLSFFFVQLAAFGENDFSLIRSAQVAAAQLPNVGFVTAIDLGDPSSTYGAVHSRRKQEVGRRLSLVARSIQYKERGGLVWTGPILRGIQLYDTNEEGNAIAQLSFDPGTADGLHTVDTPECQQCCVQAPFHIFLGSGQWVRVDYSYVREADVFLVAGTTDRILGIRYAWDGYPQCVLFNGEGGPDDHAGVAAAPFEWCAFPSGSPPWTGSACTVPTTVQQENHI